jgi:hypothetical protein
MSRQLPPRPSLEHLRKQAKDLLQELQQRNPVAQLADAQHAIARKYGFTSWPKLKAYVESQSGTESELQSPFVGQWKVNVPKSKRHPANQFQRGMVEFVVSGDTVKIADVVVDASGREERRLNTIQVDGHEHASESGNGYSLLATWRGSHVLETVATKDGQVVGRGIYEVSRDAKTLTVSGDDMLIVFDRISHSPRRPRASRSLGSRFCS